MERDIILDTETTGLKPSDGHRLVEIGCVEMINRAPTGRTFHVYINPERDMPMGAFNVHGLSESFLADKPLFSDVADDFLEFVRDGRLIIHNANFDMGFINYELQNIPKPTIPKSQVFCTLVEARKRFAGSPNNLDALCKRFNIDNSKRTKHGALLDAELLADVYIELMGGNQHALSFDAQNAARAAEAAKQSAGTAKQTRAARPFPVSEEEKQRHFDFIDQLNDPIWKKVEESSS